MDKVQGECQVPLNNSQGNQQSNTYANLVDHISNDKVAGGSNGLNIGNDNAELSFQNQLLQRQIDGNKQSVRRLVIFAAFVLNVIAWFFAENWVVNDVKLRVDVIFLLFVGAFDWVFALLSPLLILIIYIIAVIIVCISVKSLQNDGIAQKIINKISNMFMSLKSRFKKTYTKPQQISQQDVNTQSKKVKFSNNLEQVRNIDDVDKSFKERMQGSYGPRKEQRNIPDVQRIVGSAFIPRDPSLALGCEKSLGVTIPRNDKQLDAYGFIRVPTVDQLSTLTPRNVVMSVSAGDDSDFRQELRQETRKDRLTRLQTISEGQE